MIRGIESESLLLKAGDNHMKDTIKFWLKELGLMILRGTLVAVATGLLLGTIYNLLP